MTYEDVLKEIHTLAEQNGYKVSENAEKIAKAKIRFFGEAWQKCPCVHDGKHACISEACRKHIETFGKCHCNLFLK